MSLIEEKLNRIQNSVTLKLIVIGFMILILLIPASMIESLINDRSRNHEKVVEEITGKWGNKQVIAGPVLTLPYNDVFEKDGKTYQTVSYAHFLPEKLGISGDITPEIRKRNIYKVMLYNSKISLEGNFNKPDIASLKIPEDRILWNDAFITVGVPDMRGIRRAVTISWNKEVFTGKPGVISRDIITSGINTPVTVNAETNAYSFKIFIDLNGSESLSFLPFGKETHTTIKSSWNSPSFSGAFLPEKRTVSPNGFTAEWHILHLNRNYPQQWIGDNQQNVIDSAFGTDLLFPVDNYQKATRSAKYAVMFLFLTFLAFFLNEILNKKRIHPIQYVMIGLALIIFYILLVSLSEYIGFNVSYAIASLATVCLISVYSMSILNRKGGIVITIILFILYGFLFVLLQLEDYSLMIGSIGLFVILAFGMIASRKIDWYSPLKGSSNHD